MSWLRVRGPLLTGQLLDSVQGLRLSRAFRLCGWGAAGGWGLGPGDGEAEGAGEAAAAADMCGGGEGGESLSSPDICIERKYSTVQYNIQYSTVQYSTCMERKYLAAAWRSCSRSSAVWRLNNNSHEKCSIIRVLQF